MAPEPSDTLPLVTLGGGRLLFHGLLKFGLLVLGWETLFVASRLGHQYLAAKVSVAQFNALEAQAMTRSDEIAAQLATCVNPTRPSRRIKPKGPKVAKADTLEAE